MTAVGTGYSLVVVDESLLQAVSGETLLLRLLRNCWRSRRLILSFRPELVTAVDSPRLLPTIDFLPSSTMVGRTLNPPCAFATRPPPKISDHRPQISGSSPLRPRSRPADDSSELRNFYNFLVPPKTGIFRPGPPVATIGCTCRVALHYHYSSVALFLRTTPLLQAIQSTRFGLTPGLNCYESRQKKPTKLSQWISVN